MFRSSKAFLIATTLIFVAVATERIRIGFSEALAASFPFGKENSHSPPAQPPPNNAPQWNSTPSPSFTLGIAASYNLLSNASDLDGDPLTFVNETGCTLPTGITIDNTNKELDYDGTGTAGTTTGCVFSADDGTASPVNSSAFSIVITDTSGDLGYPRVASVILDGWQTGSHNTSDLNEWAKANWFQANFGATLASNPTIPGVNLTHQGILDHMRTQNSDIVLTMYFNAHSWFEKTKCNNPGDVGYPCDAPGNETTYRNTIILELRAENGPGSTDWYGYGTNGTSVFSDWGSGDNRQIHLNWSTHVTAQTGTGWKVAEYTANRIYDDAWSKPTVSGWDGFFVDVYRTEPNNASGVDFNQDGSSSEDQNTIYKEYERDVVNYLVALIGGDPIRTGNIANTWVPAKNKNEPTPEYTNLLHGGLWEGAMGKTWSDDQDCSGAADCLDRWKNKIGQVWWQFSDLNRSPPNGYGAGFMRDLPAGLPADAEAPFVMFGTVINDTNNAAEYQQFRYHLATCMVTGDGYCNHQKNNGQGWEAWQDYDEYHKGTENVRNYCGQPIDAAVNPATASAWSNGTYARRFDNCLVIVNPDGNGNQGSLDVRDIANSGSFSCSDCGLWKYLNGNQAPTINTGNNISAAISIDDADGRVLLAQ